MATKRRFCTNCGGQVFENSKFCGTCGSSLADDGPPAVVSPPVQAAPPQPPPPPAYQPPPPAYAPQPPPSVYQPVQSPAYQTPPQPVFQPPPQYPSPQPGYQPPQGYQPNQSGYQPQQGYSPPPGYPQPPAYAAPPQAYGNPLPAGGIPGETLTGIIPGASRKKNLISAEGFNIVVTNQRMIFALMTNQMVQEEAKRNSAGKGFFGGVAAGMTAGYNLWRRYLEMPPEQALRENQGNFAIYLAQIRRVKFEGGRTLLKKGPISIGLNVNRDDDEPARLEIETMNDKFKFEIATDFQGEAREVLRRAGLIK